MIDRDFKFMIMPLGLLFLLNIFGEWGVDKGGNPYILGILISYLSYVIVYWAFIRIEFKKYKHNQINERR